MYGRERILAWYLRAYALVLLLALPATVVPTSWLATAHEWLGLGPWPDLPLLEYLARSASGVYASFGGIALLASFDVRRFRPIILFIAWLSVPGALYLFVLGWAIHMPKWWVAVEGPMVILSAVPLFVLSKPASS